MHVSNYFATPSQLELAERLKRITGAGEGGRVYFGNSGAEANEAAFKLARRNGGRTRILALKNAFHGRTMGALALTGKPSLQRGVRADGARASSTSTRRWRRSRSRCATTWRR